MEDLLATFHEPCIMDCKIGTRTYLEEDIDKSEPRAVRKKFYFEFKYFLFFLGFV
jgi:1D-myo-inositol-triphosphate 3-kinase